MANFDLTIIPLHRRAGADRSILTGLYAAAPPRRAARGRKTEQLIVLLTFSGEPPFNDDRMTELLDRLAKGFYETPGSLTSASREMIEELNSLLLNINLRAAAGRPKISAAISVMVVRNDVLYLAQSGPGHLFVLMPRKVDYINDERAAGRGLGVSRTAAIYYAQLPILAHYRLLFTPHMPDSWTAETFQAAHNQPLTVAHRCFMEHAGEEIEGALVEILPGSGAVTLLSAGESLRERTPPPLPSTPSPAPISEKTAPAADAWEELSTQEEIPEPAPEIEAERFEIPEPEEVPVKRAAPAPRDTPRAEIPIYSAAAPEEPTPALRQNARRVGPAILAAVRKLRLSSAKGISAITEFFQRVLPWEEMAKIPTSYAAFIAIAVPFVVITVGSLVYFQRGQTQQYRYYLEQAEAQIELAQINEDVTGEYQSWKAALGAIDAAEEYFTTDESSSLRRQVTAALDDLDEVTRLEFVPAIAGSMASSIKIRQMFATSNEIFMLDPENDQIYRARLIGDHYEMDPDFNCRSGRYGSLNVEGLIDMAPLPTNADEASLVAIDSGGNLLYCYPEKPPVAVPLVPPDNYFSDRIVGITIESDNLYILDEGRNMVWYYTPSDDNFQYRDAPYFFFQDEVPEMLGTIDFAVDKEQLYLLYRDSWQTTTCTFSTMEEARTTCREPADYTDTRPGRESGPVIDGAIFVQIQHTQPPEPSLFYLDPINRSVYHFSLRLNLVQQYQPQIGFEDGPITAFAIGPSRHIFIAMNNKVYISALP